MIPRFSLALALVCATALPVSLSAAEVMMHKNPSCGCCSEWGRYLQQQGHKVQSLDHADMEAVKDQHKVPPSLRSCHTATVQGYVIEGHVPAEAIDYVLQNRPNIRGLAAPGMPQGSPGMSGAKEPNPVYMFGEDGIRLLKVY